VLTEAMQIQSRRFAISWPHPKLTKGCPIIAHNSCIDIGARQFAMQAKDRKVAWCVWINSELMLLAPKGSKKGSPFATTQCCSIVFKVGMQMAAGDRLNAMAAGKRTGWAMYLTTSPRRPSWSPSHGVVMPGTTR